MPKFHKKTTVVDAIIFDGDNFKECLEFIGSENVDNTLNYPNVRTLEGNTIGVGKGDYIVKDKDFGIYPYSPHNFKKVFEEISEEMAAPHVDSTFKSLSLAIAVGMQMYSEHHSDNDSRKPISVSDIENTTTYKHFFKNTNNENKEKI